MDGIDWDRTNELLAAEDLSNYAERSLRSSAMDEHFCTFCHLKLVSSLATQLRGF